MSNRNQTLQLGVFLFSLIIVTFSSISIIFPAFIGTTIIGSDSNINPFERGVWAIPFVIINIAILDLAILYYYKKLPSSITKFINFVLNFEISKKVTAITIIIIIGVYVAASYQELFIDENEQWTDFTYRVSPAIENISQSFLNSENTADKVIVKNFLLASSVEIFENVKIIPFFASISLLVLTYFFTAKIAEKRFAGIIALIVLVQSRTFLEYDTTAAYSNFWTLFYLLSLYLVYKKWYLSTPVFILSMFCKPVTIIFLPLTLFFILRTKLTKRKKILTIIPYFVIIPIIVIVTIGVVDADNSGDYLEFLKGFTLWVFQLRYDAVLITLLLPLTIGLYLLSKRGVIMADALLILIAGVILSAPLLAGFTGYNIHPYRFMPLVVFFAVGIGLLFGKRLGNRS